VVREYFYLFLDWHWDIGETHIKMPETKDEIDHVENIYRLIGYHVIMKEDTNFNHQSTFASSTLLEYAHGFALMLQIQVW
jgi:hypothetical protein